MDVSQVTNPALQQLCDALNPQGSTSPSNSQVTSTDTQGVQGHHHHHHHKSMNDMISKMEGVIDDAAKAGKLTDDQANEMKKELDSITQAIQQNQSSPGMQGRQSTQLTSDDLEKVRTEFQEVRKQLFDALNPQVTTATSNGIDSLFKQMDTNGDGVVDKNEFSTFISTLI